MATEKELLERITVRPDVFGSKPIVRNMRIAVEHILGMLAAGDTTQMRVESATRRRSSIANVMVNMETRGSVTFRHRTT